MNKYQEALDYVNKSVCTALSCLGVNDTKTKESLHTLQELVDKEKEYTIEEVKKEWEELGYEWIDKNDDLINIKHKKDIAKDILIYTSSKKYISIWTLSFQENQLLTKTFKAFGWL